MRLLYLAIGCLLAGLAIGCGAERSSPSSGKTPGQNGVAEGNAAPQIAVDEVGQKLHEAAQAVKQYSAEKGEEGLDQIRAKVGDVREEVVDWKQETRGMRDSVRKKVDDAIENVNAALQDVDQKLDRLRDASGDAWLRARDDLQESWSHLEVAYTKAAGAFKDANEDANSGKGEGNEDSTGMGGET